jgi:flagellar export protein FliJ
MLRNVFYTNAGVKRLLAEFIGGSGGPVQRSDIARTERQLEIKDRRILQLEQQLASAKAEMEELRKLLATAEQKLARYELIEEEVLKAGRRVVP